MKSVLALLPLFAVSVLSRPIRASNVIIQLRGDDSIPSMTDQSGDVVPFDPAKLTLTLSRRSASPGDTSPTMSNGGGDVVPFDPSELSVTD
ncbi:MAG: hypothetical protein M1838_001911 [Thelocarpon superellum]|nr:MAG: hypothetical protein M1838_001911 [Thelocarpon superellum]